MDEESSEGNLDARAGDVRTENVEWNGERATGS